MERKLFGLLAAPVNYSAGHDVTYMLTSNSFFQSRQFRRVNPRSSGGFQQPRTQAMASNGAAKTLRRLFMREVEQEPAKQEEAKQQLITREPLKAYQYTEQAYLTARTRRVAQYFPRALGLDDFLNRLEIALFAYGFTGENCIGKHKHYSSCLTSLWHACMLLLCPLTCSELHTEELVWPCLQPCPTCAVMKSQRP